MLNDIYQTLDPVLFSLGPFTVRWYGIAYVLGFVCAALVIWRVARRWRVRVDADSLLTIMFCVIIGVIVGGRLGYVLFYGDYDYLANPLEIIAVNHGGMSFHGGLIGALLAGVFFYWVLKKEDCLVQVNLARRRPLGRWFYPTAKYLYCGVTVLVLILGAVNGGIG